MRQLLIAASTTDSSGSSITEPAAARSMHYKMVGIDRLGIDHWPTDPKSTDAAFCVSYLEFY